MHSAFITLPDFKFGFSVKTIIIMNIIIMNGLYGPLYGPIWLIF